MISLSSSVSLSRRSKIEESIKFSSVTLSSSSFIFIAMHMNGKMCTYAVIGVKFKKTSNLVLLMQVSVLYEHSHTISGEKNTFGSV